MFPNESFGTYVEIYILHDITPAVQAGVMEGPHCPLAGLLRAPASSPADQRGQRFASPWRLSKAHRDPKGLARGAWPGGSALWMGSGGTARVLTLDAAFVSGSLPQPMGS
jgi:hypothetical protein